MTYISGNTTKRRLLIADLRTLLHDSTTPRPTGGTERELPASSVSVPASAPLPGGVEHCEPTEGS